MSPGGSTRPCPTALSFHSKPTTAFAISAVAPAAKITNTRRVAATLSPYLVISLTTVESHGKNRRRVELHLPEADMASFNGRLILELADGHYIGPLYLNYRGKEKARVILITSADQGRGGSVFPRLRTIPIPPSGVAANRSRCNWLRAICCVPCVEKISCRCRRPCPATRGSAGQIWNRCPVTGCSPICVSWRATLSPVPTSARVLPHHVQRRRQRQQLVAPDADHRPWSPPKSYASIGVSSMNPSAATRPETNFSNPCPAATVVIQAIRARLQSRIRTRRESGARARPPCVRSGPGNCYRYTGCAGIRSTSGVGRYRSEQSCSGNRCRSSTAS